ncbi:MAG TPA: hypothetical protein VFA56_11970 [Gaiellaceae bacterium]|nr:hypothetical protein [Gaiellaceae bacterium]
MSEPVEQLRAVVESLPPAPTVMTAYLGKVRERAYTVTDADVEALRGELTDDEIFEQTIGAAVGEGLRRLDRADAVLE